MLCKFGAFACPASVMQLYFFEPATLRSEHIVEIPNGPGFPAVNTLAFDTFYFSDITSFYKLDLVAKEVVMQV